MTDHDTRGCCGHDRADCKCNDGGQCRFGDKTAERFCHSHRADTAVHSPEDARGPTLRGTPATVRAGGPLPTVRVTAPQGTARAVEPEDDGTAAWLRMGVDWRGGSR